MTFRSISLALRLTLSIGAVITLVLLGFGYAVERSIDRHFVQQDVDELNAVVDAVTQALAETQPDPAEQYLAQRLAGVLAGHHNAQFKLSSANGQLIYASSAAEFAGFEQEMSATDAISIETVQIWRAKERSYRGAVVQLESANGLSSDTLTLTVATDIAFHLHYLHSFRVYLRLMTLAACLIAILATWFAVYQGHAPLRRISAEIRRIKSDHLSIRLAPNTVPVELTELAVSFNDMLDRIEEGFSRLSNFSADIAHELRTPITNLRTQTEVALSQSRDIEQYREILYSNLEEYERMAKMVGDMLFLAQADNHQLQAERVSVNLATEVQMLFDYFEAWAEERQVSLVCTGPAVFIQGDRLMIRRALSNLLSNAIGYTVAGQTVSVTLALGLNNRVMIQVENPGLNVSPEHLSKLFDRFYRADPSRQRTGHGAGLGLAIVKSIIDAHGGSICAKSEEGQMIFTIELPKAYEDASIK